MQQTVSRPVFFSEQEKDCHEKKTEAEPGSDACFSSCRGD